jgi:hypothetical protein
LFGLWAARLTQNLVLNQVELEYFIGTKVAGFVVIFPMALVLTGKFRQPSHEFTLGVGMTFISYPLVLTPLI